MKSSEWGILDELFINVMLSSLLSLDWNKPGSACYQLKSELVERLVRTQHDSHGGFHWSMFQRSFSLHDDIHDDGHGCEPSSTTRRTSMLVTES